MKLTKPLGLLLLALSWDHAFSQTENSPAPKTASPGQRAPLPENVERRAVTIFSDGVRMAGDLYLPRTVSPEAKLPAIVLCAGTGGTKGGTGTRLGAIFAQHGYVALAFDYRGWGLSDSKLITVEKQPRPDANGDVEVRARAVRWQMDFADQAMDIRAAISFIAGEPNIDRNRIGIWGSSYGGGLVTWTAGNDPRVKCVAAQVPGLGPPNTPETIARTFEYLSKQARGEVEAVPFETGKMTGKMERYTQMRVNPTKRLGYSPAEAAEKITAPIIYVVAENEELGSNTNVERVHLAIKARGIPTEYHVLKGITHYGVYGEGFDEATRLELAWFDRFLKETPPR
jgi:dipeptidyl aminopeptidase/acylaminoacyl peptidase